MIYFLRSKKSNEDWFKIVFLDSVEELKELMASLEKVYAPLDLVAEDRGTKDTETYLHQKYRFECFGDGGWFVATDRLCCYISSLNPDIVLHSYRRDVGVPLRSNTRGLRKDWQDGSVIRQSK